MYIYKHFGTILPDGSFHQVDKRFEAHFLLKQ